jgi:hypothetical protein
MANLGNFDANTVEPAGDFSPIPGGKYVCVISASEMKPTKAGDGEYLQLEFTVLEGECKGRKVWTRLNLQNKNQTAKKIAEGELSAICHAVGVMTPKDSTELHDLPLMVTVIQKKREDTGDLTNECKSFSKRETGQAATAPQADSNVPPWGRK